MWLWNGSEIYYRNILLCSMIFLFILCCLSSRIFEKIFDLLSKETLAKVSKDVVNVPQNFVLGKFDKMSQNFEDLVKVDQKKYFSGTVSQ